VSELTLTHEVFPQPPRVGPLTITLRVADGSGKPATGISVKLEGNMSHAGMTPVFAGANETEPGRYSSTMELSMAGDWYFVVHMALPDGRKLERQFEIKGVGQP
jgi:YtkA-like